MTDYVKNICIKSDTLVPNALIYGNPTISDGVANGFSEENYLQVLNGKQDNNTEYVVKFTTGSTTKSTTQDILHAQNFFALEMPLNTWDITTYNWETGTGIILFTASANTTYWVKILVNGKTKTFSYSTDGENYTQVASFTDNDMDITNIYQLRIGNISLNSLLSERAFLGSVDLNETYINVNNVRFWESMDYKKYYPIGGDVADGKYVNKSSTIYSGKPSYTFHRTISLSSYLPDDNYDYEVTLDSHLYTGASSGNFVTARIATGTVTSDNFSDAKALTGGRINTRTASIREGACSGTLPIYSTDRNITLHYTGAGSMPSSNTNNISVNLSGYKRIGTNDTTNNNIEKINNQNSVLVIGGDNFSGQWIDANFTQIANYTYTAGNTYTFNLKTLNLIPNDNYEYEVILSGWCATGTTSGNWCCMLVSSSIATSTIRMNYSNTRTANKTDSWKVSVIPIGADGKLYVKNNGTSGTSASTQIYLCGYRRIGINE